MIHDLIYSCLSLSRKGVIITDCLDLESMHAFIHPSEHILFEKIIEILQYANEVVRFAKFFGGVRQISDYDEADDFCSGYYLRSFAKGIENAFKDYYIKIAELEKSLMKTSTPNFLIFIYNALELQLPAILFLRSLINDAKVQKLSGCKLLQNLHQKYDNGNVYIDQTIPKVTKPVKLAFFSQLCHWLLFGDIDDQHSEFFIRYKCQPEGTLGRLRKGSDILIPVKAFEIWQYEINFSQLPSFVSVALAEKVLFIGQTTLVFRMDRKPLNEHTFTMQTQISFCDEYGELWDGKEGTFVKMIEALNEDDKIDVFHMENVINVIKKHVSKRLSEIAVGKQDLDRQMYLIKDFYLLGRGEFYMEFFRYLDKYSQCSSIDEALELTSRVYTKSFETAANVMGISDELENFSLSVLKTIDLDETCEFARFQNLHLKYIYKWPLNLLFSPTTVERYNTVFRFLLIVRKLQYDLESVWARHKSDAKTAPVNVKIMQFRNHLMFFINNLQYYIQVDVLESQFSILMNVIQNKADFEEIQTAHSVFLANVLSQCFLLTDETDKKPNTKQPTSNFQYPVHGTILEIFNVCEEFSQLSSLEKTPEETLDEVDYLEERFNDSILGLIKLLVNIKHGSSFGTLSQLLLRLDYNRWFSVNTNAEMTAKC